MSTLYIRYPASGGTGGINQLTGDVTAGPGTGSQVATLGITTTKGDLIVRDNSANVRLPVGGDGLVLVADSTQATGIKWASVAGTGDVVGPASATDNAVSRFDGTTGKLIQNSVVIIGDTGNTSGVLDFTGTGVFTFGSANAGAITHKFVKDVNAGDTVQPLNLFIGNSSGAQGGMNFQWNNRGAAASPSSYWIFQPRNNADSSDYVAGSLAFEKITASNSSALTLNLFENITGAGAFVEHSFNGQVPTMKLNPNGTFLQTSDITQGYVNGALRLSGAANLLGAALVLNAAAGGPQNVITFLQAGNVSAEADQFNQWIFGRPSASSRSHAFYKDVNAGDSTTAINLSIGNSGGSQGSGVLSYTNAAAGDSPTFDIAFNPRNNAGSGGLAGTLIRSQKQTGDNGTNIYFYTSDTGGAQNLVMTLTPGKVLEMGPENEIHFDDAAGGQYVGFKAPAVVTGSGTYTLPVSFPASNMVLQSDNAGVMSWVTQAAAPSGTPNTFAGFDGGGAVYTIPDWDISTNTGGVSFVRTQTIASDNYNYAINLFENEIDPAIVTTNVSYTGLNLDIHHDRTGSNNNYAGNVTGVYNTTSLEGDGDVGSAFVYQSNLVLGTGTNTGSITGTASFTDENATIGAGYSVDTFTGHRSVLNIQATGAVDDVAMVSLGGSGDVANNLDYYYAGTNFDAVNNTRVMQFDLNGDTGNDFSGINIGTSGTTGNNYTAFNSNNSGAITGNMNGFAVSNSGVISDQFFGVNINNNGASDASFMISAQNNQNVTNGSRGIDMRIDGNADNKILLNVYSNAGAVTNGWAGLAISAGGSAASTTGVSVNLTGITSTAQKVGLDIDDGALLVDSQYDTSVYPASPGFLQLNAVGGVYEIAAGSPVTNTLVFGNNLGPSAIFADNMGPDAFGGFVGYGVNGLIAQTAVAVGKTVDTMNLMVAAASIPTGVVPTDGGTITNFCLYSAPGVLNAGGSIVMTNVWGMKLGSLLSTYATNCWGFYVSDPNADNFFKKSVSIGTSTEKSAAGIALEIGTSVGTFNLNANNILMGGGSITGIGAGSAGSPSLAGTGSSSDSGIYFSATDQVAISTAGVRAANFDDAGQSTFGNAQSGNTTHKFIKDATAGATTNSITVLIGNSGGAQGSGQFVYKNASASGSPNMDIVFGPRNNADSGDIVAGRIRMQKGSGDDSGTMTFSTSTTGGTLNPSILLNPDQSLEAKDNVAISTVGKGIKIAEGSNARMGVATLVAGTVTVSNTTITANTRIFLTHQNNSGTVGFVTVSARTASTDFTILSSSATDTSDIAWLLIEPN